MCIAKFSSPTPNLIIIQVIIMKFIFSETLMRSYPADFNYREIEFRKLKNWEKFTKLSVKLIIDKLRNHQFFSNTVMENKH